MTPEELNNALQSAALTYVREVKQLTAAIWRANGAVLTLSIWRHGRVVHGETSGGKVLGQGALIEAGRVATPHGVSPFRTAVS